MKRIEYSDPCLKPVKNVDFKQTVIEPHKGVKRYARRNKKGESGVSGSLARRRQKNKS